MDDKYFDGFISRVKKAKTKRQLLEIIINEDKDKLNYDFIGEGFILFIDSKKTEQDILDIIESKECGEFNFNSYLVAAALFERERVYNDY